MVIRRHNGKRSINIPSPFPEASPRIWLIPILSRREAAEMVEILRAIGDWNPARVGGPAGERIVKRDVRHCMTIPARRCPPMVHDIPETISIAAARIGKELSELQISATTIVKYASGGFYVDHTDSDPSSTRLFSIVTYLNDDFIGGCTVFPRRGISLKPSPGQAILFPSDEIHRGETVLSGEKYIATNWLSRAPGAS